MSEKRVPIAVGEAALMFGVDPKTVVRWAKNGKIPSFTTIGGHHRFYVDDIEAIIAAATAVTTESAVEVDA